MRKIDLALITLILILLMITLAGATVSNWNQPQVTLEPGQVITVVFDNPENIPIILTINSISAPISLVPYLFVSPTTIPENSSREVTLQFVQVPQSIRENILPDIYALRVNGGDSNLLVYLDLSVPLPENAENRWAELEDRIDAVQNSFAAQMNALAVRITALESAPNENWMSEFEALWENLIRLGDWTTSQIMELWAAIPENSPHADMLLWQAMLDDVENELRTEQEMASNQLRMDYEAQIASAEDENEQLRLTAYAAIAIAIVAVALTIRRPKLSAPSLKPKQRQRLEEIPLDDKIAMLENEIDAMRERGDPDDSIKKKESELWGLRKQLKSKRKRKGES